MKHYAEKKTRIAALNKEMDAIHFVNNLYWQRRETNTTTARAEYRRRLDRLYEIRSELARLQSE